MKLSEVWPESGKRHIYRNFGGRGRTKCCATTWWPVGDCPCPKHLNEPHPIQLPPKPFNWYAWGQWQDERYGMGLDNSNPYLREKFP